MEVDGKKITFKTANEDEVRIILDGLYAPLQWGLVVEDFLAILQHDPEAITIAVHETGEIIAAVIFMKINDQDAGFGGFCVKEEFRGKGIGLAIHNMGFNRVCDMNVTLTAAEEMFLKYKSKDYPIVSMIKGIRYAGPIDKSTVKASPGVTIIHYKPEMLKRILDYDKLVMSHQRDDFMKKFLPLVKGSIVIAEENGEMCGYGMLRGNTHMLGPIFAESVDIAKTIIAALLKNISDDVDVVIDIPSCCSAILELAKENCMKWVFTFPRQFSKEEIEINWKKVFALHSPQIMFV